MTTIRLPDMGGMLASIPVAAPGFVKRFTMEVGMNEGAVSLLAGWESFYVIVGSSAAALTGLQFVIMALIAESDGPGGSQEIAAFGSPTVVHFCTALLVSTICSAPWPQVSSAGLAVSAVGFGGLLYTAVVFRRARRQSGYKPVFEDWLSHTILPTAAYVVLLVSGLWLASASAAAFLVGAAALLLVFIGIHNAWDTVTYVAVDMRAAPKAPRAPVSPSPPVGETESKRGQ